MAKLICNTTKTDNIYSFIENVHKNETINDFSCYVGYASTFGFIKVLDLLYKQDNNPNTNIFYGKLINNNIHSYSSKKEYLKCYVGDLFSTIETFSRLQKKLTTIQKKCNIYQVNNNKKNSNVEFHGKLYEIKTDVNYFSIIGSSNLTKTGLYPPVDSLNEINLISQNDTKLEVKEFKNKFTESWQHHSKIITEFLEDNFKINVFDNIGYDFCQYIYKSYFKQSENIYSVMQFVEKSGWKYILKEYQIETLKNILTTMETCGGAILNYDVGLGKTLIGLAVADFYSNGNICCVITPNRLTEDWKKYLSDKNPYYFFYNNEKKELRKWLYNSDWRLKMKIKRIFSYNDYINQELNPNVLVVDEAHNFRNSDTKKRNDLLKKIFFDDEFIVKGEKKYSFKYSSDIQKQNSLEVFNKDKTLLMKPEQKNKKILLITATPVSNSSQDIKMLLDILPNNENPQKDYENIYQKRLAITEYFNDENDKNKTALSLVHNNAKMDDVNKLIMYFFNRLNKDKWRYFKEKNNFDNFLFPRRKNITNQCKFILDNDELSKQIFSQKQIEQAHACYNKIVNIIEDINTCTKNDPSDIKGLLAEKAHTIIIYNYMFTLNSSLKAFRKSICLKLDAFSKFEGVYIDFDYHNDDTYEVELDKIEDDDNIIEKKLNDDFKKATTKEFKEHILKYNDLVNKKYKELLDATDDAIRLIENEFSFKLKYLNELLKKPEIKNRKKIIFSTRLTTIKQLHDNFVNSNQQTNVISYSGKSIRINNSEFDSNKINTNIVKYLYAPISNNNLYDPKWESNDIYKRFKDTKFDILICSNTMAEGHNLQDASVLINYDIDWNPTIMLQRVGRIDRYRDFNQFSLRNNESYNNSFKLKNESFQDIKTAREHFKDIYVYNFFWSSSDAIKLLNIYPNIYKKLKIHDIFNSVSLTELYVNENDEAYKKYLQQQENKIAQNNQEQQKIQSILHEINWQADSNYEIETGTGSPSLMEKTQNKSRHVGESKCSVMFNEDNNYCGVLIICNVSNKENDSIRKHIAVWIDTRNERKYKVSETHIQAFSNLIEFNKNNKTYSISSEKFDQLNNINKIEEFARKINLDSSEFGSELDVKKLNIIDINEISFFIGGKF